MDKLDLIKIIRFFSVKAYMKRILKKLQIGKKYLQTACLTKDQYLEYIKNAQNATVENQTVQLENGQNIYNAKIMVQPLWKTV